MELKYEDYSNLNSINENTTKKVRYWDETQIDNQFVEQPKKKKVSSYDDILKNMNLVVSPDGVLQYMTIKKETQNETTYQQAIDPSVKHSYIYNKYFKDYKDIYVPQQEPQKPQTIEELKQLLLEENIKRIQQKIRIQQIKPKHMLFSNSGGMQATKNNLHKMSFF